jgi:hypothetical protein
MTMGKVVQNRGRRLKGLEEFEKPRFVGRMARIERRRKIVWYAMLSAAVVAGVWIGMALF